MNFNNNSYLDSVLDLINLNKILIKEIDLETNLEEIRKLLDKVDKQSAIISQLIMNG